MFSEHLLLKTYLDGCFRKQIFSFENWDFDNWSPKKIYGYMDESNYKTSLVACVEYELLVKGNGILHHIRRVHSFEGNQIFSICKQRELKRWRRWLKSNSPVFMVVKSIAKNKITLKNLKRLSNVCHTGCLELYHSILSRSSLKSSVSHCMG